MYVSYEPIPPLENVWSCMKKKNLTFLFQTTDDKMDSTSDNIKKIYTRKKVSWLCPSAVNI